MLINAPLLVSRAAITACPTDPWADFMAWLFCNILSGLGVDTSKLNSDLVAGYLSGGTGGAHGQCAGLVESIAGSACITHGLWQVTDVAGFPLVVLVMGARYMKVLSQGDYSASPGWSLVDPILRAIVAVAFIAGSFDIMVRAHDVALSVGGLAYQGIGAAGGADTHRGLSGLDGGGILVTIVQWLYGLYILILTMASIVGYQICIVLAPLVIPLWVYGGGAGLFSWFGRTVVGGLALPVAEGIGWGTILVLTHQFDPKTSLSSTFSSHFFGSLSARFLEFVILTAGIWFLHKLISATSGELFRGRGMLATLFFAETTLLASTRIGGAMLPVRARDALARSTARLGRLAPWGTMRMAQRTFTGQRLMVNSVIERMRGNTPLRLAMAGWMGPELIAEHANITSKLVRSNIRSGNWREASRLVSTFEQEVPAQPVIDAFNRLPMDQQLKLAYQAVAHERIGTGHRNPALENRGRAAIDAAMGPRSRLGREARFYREALQYLNTSKEVPDFLRAPNTSTDSLPRTDPSRPLPRPPSPGNRWS